MANARNPAAWPAVKAAVWSCHYLRMLQDAEVQSLSAKICMQLTCMAVDMPGLPAALYICDSSMLGQSCGLLALQ